MHGRLKNFPWMLCGVCLGITGLGLCGLVRADELYGRSQLIERQIVWLMMALPLMLFLLPDHKLPFPTTKLASPLPKFRLPKTALPFPTIVF